MTSVPALVRGKGRRVRERLLVHCQKGSRSFPGFSVVSFSPRTPHPPAEGEAGLLERVCYAQTSQRDRTTGARIVELLASLAFRACSGNGCEPYTVLIASRALPNVPLPTSCAESCPFLPVRLSVYLHVCLSRRSESTGAKAHCGAQSVRVRFGVRAHVRIHIAGRAGKVRWGGGGGEGGNTFARRTSWYK